MIKRLWVQIPELLVDHWGALGTSHLSSPWMLRSWLSAASCGEWVKHREHFCGVLWCGVCTYVKWTLHIYLLKDHFMSSTYLIDELYWSSITHLFISPPPFPHWPLHHKSCMWWNMPSYKDSNGGMVVREWSCSGCIRHSIIVGVFTHKSLGVIPQPKLNQSWAALWSEKESTD